MPINIYGPSCNAIRPTSRSDYRCSHWTAISGDRWPDDVRLSDLEPRFAGASLIIKFSKENLPGRHNPQGKSGCPALLEPSLKVQRDITHNSHSAFTTEIHRR
jgi:hypothetical protein